MSDPYFTLAFFKDHTTIDVEDVEAFEQRYPGRIEKLIVTWSRYLDAFLRKIYVVPFAPPIPIEICINGTRLVTAEVMKIRGYTPGTSQKEVCDADVALATEFLKELRDPENGRLELPLKNETPEAEGVAKGGPLFFSEQSPYDWTDAQVEAVRG